MLAPHTLRPYQAAAITRLRATIATGVRSAVLVAPTGAGKTLIIRDISVSAVARGRSVIVIAPRRELVRQASQELDAVGLDHGILQSDHWRRRPGLPVQVATLDTLRRRQVPEPAITIIDEAHLNLTACLDLRKRWPTTIMIGFTATPCRTDGRGLGELYQSLIEVATPHELIEAGYLCGYRAFAPPAPDLSGVATRGGDYAPGQLASAVDRPHLTGDAVATWRRLAHDRPTLVFATGIKHSRHLAEAFGGVHLDGTSRDQSEVLTRMRSGELQIVTCADLLLYGVNVEIVSCVVVCRPTKSMALHRQMCGRGLRIAPGKSDLLILDHAGNVHRNGLPDSPIAWSLEGVPKRTGEPPLTTCHECFAVYSAALATCPACGAQRPTVPRSSIAVRDGQLEEVTSYGARATPEQRSATIARWRATAAARGYKPGWVAYRYKATFGRWPHAGELR